jgi:preprotein translocase subunit SecE
VLAVEFDRGPIEVRFDFVVVETLMTPADWFRDTRQYFVEVGGEYRKITWPPQKEARAGAVGVVAVVAVVTVVLGVVDFGLSRIMQLVLQ